MSDLASIIITSFRRPKLLRGAIVSALQQTHRSTEVIVVDDNSKMPAVDAVLQEFSGKIQTHVTSVSDEERIASCRYAACINIGIDISKGAFLTYLTDDDVYYPHRVATMVNWFAHHPAPEFMICYSAQSIVHIQAGGHLHLAAIRPTVGITNRPHGRIDHCSFMHRRECLDRLARPYWPVDASVWGGGDMAFFDKLIPFWHFYPIDEILGEKREHGNSIQARMNAGLSPVYTDE